MMFFERYKTWIRRGKKADNITNFYTFLNRENQDKTIIECLTELYYAIYEIDKKFKGLYRD